MFLGIERCKLGYFHIVTLIAIWVSCQGGLDEGSG